MKNRHITRALEDNRISNENKSRLIRGARVIRRLERANDRDNMRGRYYGLSTNNCLAFAAVNDGESDYRGPGAPKPAPVIEAASLELTG